MLSRMQLAAHRTHCHLVPSKRRPCAITWHMSVVGPSASDALSTCTVSCCYLRPQHCPQHFPNAGAQAIDSQGLAQLLDCNAPMGCCRVQVKGYGVVQTVNVCTIFLVSGLTLKTDDAVQSLKHPRGLVYGLVAILALTPMFGFAVQNIPFSEAAFATGLTVFCAVPTTLSSGVALVQAVCSGAWKRG